MTQTTFRRAVSLAALWLALSALAIAQQPVPVEVGVAGFSPAVTLAIIGGAFAFLALFPPILMVIVQAWIAGRAKAADWKRLDDVRDAALAAAEATKKAQEDAQAGRIEVARVLAENTAIAAHTSADTKDRLREIHDLVNSNMTAAKQSDLDSTRRELVALNLNVVLLEAASVPGTTNAGREHAHAAAKEAIVIAEAKIVSLTTELAERKKQQAAADAAKAAQDTPADPPIEVVVANADPVPVTMEPRK